MYKKQLKGVGLILDFAYAYNLQVERKAAVYTRSTWGK